MKNAIKFLTRLPAVAGFAVFVLWELIKSNIQVIQLVLGPLSAVKPGIVRVPLDLRSERAIFVFANVITLTPGTLTVEVAEDLSCLFIHALVVGDKQAFAQGLKTSFERRIMELFR